LDGERRAVVSRRHERPGRGADRDGQALPERPPGASGPLHDGAQQEFVSAAISLKLARQKWSRAPDEALELVDAALERLESGLRDLRDLAAGIHPSVLSDRGLGAALWALADRSAVPVALGSLPSGRLPAAVATTAYFVVAEALTNAAKHAGCEHAEVGVRVEDGWAVVEVRDDGVGGADASRGSGLRGLADRVNILPMREYSSRRAVPQSSRVLWCSSLFVGVVTSAAQAAIGSSRTSALLS
jgi:signal transduction histidine kinase